MLEAWVLGALVRKASSKILALAYGRSHQLPVVQYLVPGNRRALEELVPMEEVEGWSLA